MPSQTDVAPKAISCRMGWIGTKSLGRALLRAPWVLIRAPWVLITRNSFEKILNSGQPWVLNKIIFFFTADNFRPYITSFQGNNCTDYINAVFVDVSCNKNHLTIGRGPWFLSNDVPNIVLVKLLVDHHISHDNTLGCIFRVTHTLGSTLLPNGQLSQLAGT